MINDYSDIDITTIDDRDQLEVIQMKLTIAQTMATIEKMRQDGERAERESIRAERESQMMMQKLIAETEKLQKERYYYPAIPILLAVIGGGAFSVLMTYLLIGAK